MPKIKSVQSYKCRNEVGKIHKRLTRVAAKEIVLNSREKEEEEE